MPPRAPVHWDATLACPSPPPGAGSDGWSRPGFGVTVFLGVKLATKGRVSLEDFERAVSAIPEVQTVEHVLGLYDYRLRVVARDIPDFERVLRRRIMTLPGAGAVEANVLLSEERRPGPIGETPQRPD